MERTIKVELSVHSLQNTVKQLKKLQKELKKLNRTIPEELANKTKEQMETFYQAKGFSSDSPVRFDIKKDNEHYFVRAVGESVAYEEFGTGDVGESSDHISKDMFGGKLHLHRYNLDHLLSDGNGWIVKDYENGGYKWYHNGWTKGIPAGNFVYYADEWLHKNYKEIVKEKVGDVISKV